MYLKYLWYVLRHKWYVMIECFKVGLIWRGLVHDNSKFLPDEFFPYAKHFYGNKDGIKTGRNKTGYYKPYDTGDKAFDFAWLLHQKRNKHHWQWWILPRDEDGVMIMEIPKKYILEMVCDWKGAGKAQGTPNTIAWYEKNKDKMQLHPDTRMYVEELLGLSSGVRNTPLGEKK